MNPRRAASLRTESALAIEPQRPIELHGAPIDDEPSAEAGDGVSEHLGADRDNARRARQLDVHKSPRHQAALGLERRPTPRQVDERRLNPRTHADGYDTTRSRRGVSGMLPSLTASHGDATQRR